MYLNLKRNIVHVNGAFNSALYDLNKSKLFWLNNAETKMLNELKKSSLSNLFIKENDFLNELISRNLVIIEDKIKNYNTHLDKKPALLPTQAWFELDTGCNHKCVHCYNYSGPEISNFRMKDSEKSKKYINELAEIGITDLSFIGGEPLAHPKLLMELIAHSNGLTFNNLNLFTNGTLIDKDWGFFFKKYSINIFVTVYSHVSEIHDSITKTKNSYKQTLHGLDILNELNCKCEINFIVTPASEITINNTEIFFKQRYSHFAIKYDYIRPSGRALPLYRQLKFAQLNRYRELDSNNYFLGVGEQEFIENKFYNSCLKNKLLVDSNGLVGNCIMARDESGNAVNESISKIINGEKFKLLQELPLESINECKDCEFRYACSDCRPIAINLTGNVYNKPPECLYNPYNGVYTTLTN